MNNYNLYLLSPKKCDTQSSSNNCLSIISSKNVFKEKGYFNTNTQRSKAIYMYKLLPYSESESIAIHNSNYYSSPGNLYFSRYLLASPNGEIMGGDSALELKGIRSRLYTPAKVLINDNSCCLTINIRNIGKNQTRIIAGFSIFSKDNSRLEEKNYPYNRASKTLNVISSSKGSRLIYVDKLPDWKKGCYLVKNAKDDFSDIPNFSFVDGRIDEVKTNMDGSVSIILNNPLKETLKENEKIRVHGSEAFLITDTKILQPGEEILISREIKKDNTLCFFEKTAFPKSTFCVSPVILSAPVDSNEETCIRIKDYSLSF